MLANASNKLGLSAQVVRQTLASGVQPLLADRKRTLFIIPDATRTIPLAVIVPIINQIAIENRCPIDYLIALGTHPPLSTQAIETMLGIENVQTLLEEYGIQIFNHDWMDPGCLFRPGKLPADEVAGLTDGLLAIEIPVVINKLIRNYDQIVVCGPVFPHEVAGFSGGEKYLFPGIAGPQIIHITHWLGALGTSMDTIGKMDTPVRRIIQRAAALIETPLLNIAFCLKGSAVFGIFIGDIRETWQAAASLSARLNIITMPKQYKRVLSIPAGIYTELWTAAKAMYKLEPIVVDGGELIIYAPQLNEISQTHAEAIMQIGYHVRDFFTKQWETYQHFPWAALAHSTHLKGKGSFEHGIENPRIQVSLATGIPKEICRRLNLGYVDPRSISLADWEKDSESMLVKHAGEILYKYG